MTPDNDAADDPGDEIVVTDRDLYDHATSDQPSSPPPTPEPQPAAPTPTPPATSTTPRDGQGRFTARAPQAGPQAQQQPQATPPAQAPATTPTAEPQSHQVPLRELLEERERRQKIEAEANQMRNAWTQIQAAMQAEQARSQRPGPQALFEDPDQYLQQHVMAPLRQEGQAYMMQIKDGISREMANHQFGKQAVDAALAAMTQVRNSPQGDYAYRQIMEHGHPYAALVNWYNQARAQAQIGSDPQSWLRKQQETWMSDPKVQAEIINRVRQQQQQQAQQGNAAPNVQLPPSLSTMPAASSRMDEQGDLSDASLYRFATR